MLYSEYLQNKRVYQEEGHLLLLRRKHACLFFKPGKGKTYPCIDAIRDIDKAKNGKAKVLVMSTPDAIKNMWLKEIDPQHIMPDYTVYMTFNSAIQDSRKADLLKVNWDIIVIDECHKIKAHNTKCSKLVYALSKKAEYVFGLTGTPRGNIDVDIYCQFHNMCVADWGDISYTYFINNCCDIDQKFFRGNMIKVPTGINHRYKVGWENNIAKYSLRVGYEEDELIPPNKKVIKLQYEPTEQYKDAMKGILRIGDNETTMNKLGATLKAWQCANGFMYFTNIEDDVRQTIELNRNIKLDWLNNNLTKQPTTIVYMFEADKKHIMEQLNKMGYTYTEIVEDFKQGKYNILLLQCSRCESFNLQMCKRMIFYTFDYSYIKYNQMLHRIWRLGQDSEVEIDILVFENSIEWKIYQAIERKEKFADLFMRIKKGE